MRFLQPPFVFLTVAAFHCALSAFLKSAETEEKVAQYDGLTELRKVDQMEFEAAQQREAAQMNGTETEHSEDVHYLEAVQDESEEERVESEVDDSTAEGGGRSDTVAHKEAECDSSEEADGRQRREHHVALSGTVSGLDEVSEESTKEKDVTE